MVAWSVRRERRPAPRAAAALVVLLAALIHLLGCAHGPALTGSARADTPLLVAAVCDRTCAPDAVSSTRPAPAPGGEQPHCQDSDEPTVQPPRGIAPPVPAVDGTAPAVADHDRFPAPRTGPPDGPAPGPATDGRSRARLGVWRS
ncbi:hypothetical protein ACWD5R_40310 [Streptomyces sp. NPDC002514]|uniref:hypothetical protein n=1 Tax=unclassified Streptomyces TaxID=2593676 RepID=UPI003684F385